MSGRIRTIKPELLEDEKTAALDDATWRVFVSGLLLADDHGNLRATPGLLNASIFWASRDPRETLANVSAALATLSAAGLWRLYEIDGQHYAQIAGWTKHQRVDHPGKPRVPAPTEDAFSRGCAPNLARPSRQSRETLAKIPETLAPDPDLRPPTSDQRDPIADQDHSRPKPDDDSPPRPDSLEAVKRVFEHWRTTMGKTKAAKLDAKRRRRIEWALREYGEETALKAIDGCAATPWNAGDNPAGKRYDGLDLIFRDAEHVERFAGPSASPGGAPDPLCRFCGKPVPYLGPDWHTTGNGRVHDDCEETDAARRGAEAEAKRKAAEAACAAPALDAEDLAMLAAEREALLRGDAP